MREKNMIKVLGAGIAVFGMAAAANAATFQYSWELGATPTLNIGESANINVDVQLTQLPTPPFTEDEMGFLLYVLTDFNFNNAGHIIEPSTWGNPLVDYGYLNFLYPAPTGLTGSQLVYAGPGPIKNKANSPSMFTASTVTITALPCDDPELDYEEVFIFVGDPSSDLAMFRGDLITAVPVTNNTQAGLSFINTCQIPEPASLALIALGGLAMLRRRR